MRGCFFAAFLCVFSVSAVFAQTVTDLSVSPNPYTASGQTLTFSINFTSGNRTISSASVTSAIGVSYACSPTSGTTNTIVTCSVTYVTMAGDTTFDSSFVQEVADVNFLDNNGTNVGLGQAVIRANYSNPASDSEAPVVTVPSNIAIPTDPDLATAVVTYTAPTATDNVAVTSGPP